MIFRRDPLADPEPLVRRVYAYVAYRIGGGPDAEDLTSETFERALRYSDTYDARKGEPIGWLLGIARRCIEQRRPEPLSRPLEAADIGASGDLEGETIRRLTLAEALRELSERDRELVAFSYAGLNGGQIAELLGERRNTIDVALHRALARLRAILEREPEAEPQGRALSL